MAAGPLGARAVADQLGEPQLTDPSRVQPTANQTSVTRRSPRRSSALARSIRRIIRKLEGVSPNTARTLREKWPVDMKAVRASAGTSSGIASSRSIRSQARCSQIRSPTARDHHPTAPGAAVSAP